jgi:hypothetical protein
MTKCGSRWQKWVVGLLLGAAVLAAFWPALRCDFVAFDDPDYVTENTDIQHGLNWRSVQWAFTTGHGANWHPLTWLSHIIDWQLYGPEPAGHHLTSLLLHAANVVLLFLLLNQMTGALWRSAWVAAVFALHPLRVESVVWVAERKDVLSTLFWMLAVWAYVRYAKGLKFQISDFKFFYGLSLLFFDLGLMSKPMLVTLPFVLLLLDYWPLGRLEFGPRFSRRLIVEKIPFLALAFCSSAITFVVQNRSGVVASLSAVSLGERLANVPVAYVRYLGKIFWPSGLAVFYGYAPRSFFEVAGSVVLLALITVWVVWQARARPYLAVGWFWFARSHHWPGSSGSSGDGRPLQLRSQRGNLAHGGLGIVRAGGAPFPGAQCCRHGRSDGGRGLPGVDTPANRLLENSRGALRARCRRFRPRLRDLLQCRVRGNGTGQFSPRGKMF